MRSRKKGRSGDASPGSREMVVSKTPHKNATQRDTASKPTKKPKKESKWGESVLEKWRGALVKARLALRKKREKKKERHVKSTLARLRNIADAGREEGDDKLPKHQGNTPEGPPPLKKFKKKSKRSAPRVTKAHVSAVASRAAKGPVSAGASDNTSTEIPKKVRTTSEVPQPDGGSLDKPIVSVTRIKPQEPKGRTSTRRSDLGAAAKQMARKDEIRNKRPGRMEKMERRKDQMSKAAVARISASQGGAAAHDVTQVGFSLKRPSVEELRDFAKKAR